MRLSIVSITSVVCIIVRVGASNLAIAPPPATFSALDAAVVGTMAVPVPSLGKEGGEVECVRTPVGFNGVLQSELRSHRDIHGQLAGPHIHGAPRASVRACHAQTISTLRGSATEACVPGDLAATAAVLESSE
jgi:hypothetical protein